MKYSKKIIIAAISAIIIFFIAETVLLLTADTSYPAVFITCWFTFWSVEVAALAGIKVSETKISPYMNQDYIDDEDIGG